MEGLNCVRSFHLQQRHGALWLYNAHCNIDTAPPLLPLPEELESWRAQPAPTSWAAPNGAPTAAVCWTT